MFLIFYDDVIATISLIQVDYAFSNLLIILV